MCTGKRIGASVPWDVSFGPAHSHSTGTPLAGFGAVPKMLPLSGEGFVLHLHRCSYRKLFSGFLPRGG